MNQPIAEIFSQGEEVICGQVTDTNAAWMSQRLTQMGFVIHRHTAVGDKLQDLVDLLDEISQRADLCICTGGLGPTTDDLTAEAVARAFNSPLQLDPVALEKIEKYFSRRNRVMAESNRKQAYFPQGALRLDNALGSAPGFAIKNNQCWFVFLPGVPSEMKHIFNELVQKKLEEWFVLQASKLIAIKTIGIGESDLQQKLDNFLLPEAVQLGFRAKTDEVQTKLLFPADATDVEINHCVDQVINIIGDPVYAIDDLNKSTTDLVNVIGHLMQDKNYTLWVQETATQGLIAAKCIGQGWLHGSNYTQSIDAVLDQLKIPEQDGLENTVQAIANKLKENQHSDLILVQLYKGNKEQFHHKEQSIILYNALLTPHGIFQQTLTTTGPIKRKQDQAAIKALDLLRRYLQNKCH
ncbi:MAG: CinA family nicotinamide mononucleotide deamidase-related protein [Methylococcales bacterium]|nr:CinA family nicotinamide mononucleotide deamidase-related protein [Methylococcales bacterium]